MLHREFDMNLVEYGNLWIKENLIITSAYARKTLRTDSGGGRRESGVIP